MTDHTTVRDMIEEKHRTIGELLRRIDHHAAHLGAGNAASFERNEVDQACIDTTRKHLDALDTLVAEAREKMKRSAPTVHRQPA